MFLTIVAHKGHLFHGPHMLSYAAPQRMPCKRRNACIEAFTVLCKHCVQLEDGIQKHFEGDPQLLHCFAIQLCPIRRIEGFPTLQQYMCFSPLSFFSWHSSHVGLCVGLEGDPRTCPLSQVHPMAGVVLSSPLPRCGTLMAKGRCWDLDPSPPHDGSIGWMWTPCGSLPHPSIPSLPDLDGENRDLCPSIERIRLLRFVGVTPKGKVRSTTKGSAKRHTRPSARRWKVHCCVPVDPRRNEWKGKRTCRSVRLAPR